MSPSTPAALTALVKNATTITVPLFGGEGLSFKSLTGEIRHDVADGVVSCLAGTRLSDLNAALAKDDRCIPHQTVWPDEDTLAVLILLNLPHAGEATHGSWRDWILGATMVTAEGDLVKSGSRVVKSVAGYDAHKLLVGSRGALLLPAEITLRTFHISAASYPHPVQRLGDNPRSILRVRPADVRTCVSTLGNAVMAADERTGTVWTAETVENLPRFPHAWKMDILAPSVDEGALALHRRAKAILDPGGKLAPGAFPQL